jgi:hypothetical protein
MKTNTHFLRTRRRGSRLMMKSSDFNEIEARPYMAEDMRFTTK